MPDDLRFFRSDSATVPTAAPLAVARWCVARGWPVHPLAPGRKTPAGNCEECSRRHHDRATCACRAAGRWCHGFHAATLDTSLVGRWWGDNPRLGVGVACGPAKLVIVDVDAHAATPPERDRLLPGIPIAEEVDVSALTTGFHTLAVLAALRGEQNPVTDTGTLRVRTPSGGMHIWYHVSDGRRWQCSTGSGAGRALAWQVDVRAEGGYIIAPGTRTSAGTYTPVGDVRTPAPLPTWLAHELERTGHLPAERVPAPRMVPPRAQQAVVAAGGGHAKATRALSTVLAEVTACATTPEGTGFTAKLNRAAYTAGGLVAAGHLTDHDAEVLLLEAADFARPGRHRQNSQVIRSGLSAGARRPLHTRSLP